VTARKSLESARIPKNRFVESVLTAVAIAITCVAAIPAAGQNSTPSAAYKAPRAMDGHADIEGIWQVRNTSAAFDLQDHAAARGIPPGRGIIVDPPDGKIPYKQEALAKRAGNFQNRETADTLNKCYMPGVPRLTYLNFPLQIFQTPKYTLIAYEYIHIYRTIFTDGTKHIQGLDFWNGDSRGHWEGDTLVVDVSDFNDQTWFDASGDYHSGALHVVERYTRTGQDTLQYEATIEDPNVFTRPWTIRIPLYRHAEPGFRLLEYECHAYSDEEAKARK